MLDVDVDVDFFVVEANFESWTSVKIAAEK